MFAALLPAVLLAATSMIIPARAVPNAAALLRASFFAPAHVSYVGELETLHFAPEHAIATILRIEHQAPALTRRTFLAPSSLFGDSVVTHGSVRFDFDSKHKRLTISHNPLLDDQVAAVGDFTRVMRNYRAVMGAPETIAGHRAVALSLVSRFTGERIVHVLLDAQTHLVLEKITYHGNGTISSQTRFEKLRYAKHLPRALFDTTTPPGFSTLAGRDVTMPQTDRSSTFARAGFTPVEPRSLPQGFSLIRAEMTDVKGISTLHMVYADGLRLLSLFENNHDAAAAFGTLRPRNIRFEGHDAQEVQDGSTTLLSWKEHGLAFVLVGDLLSHELIPIAASVIP